MDEIFLVAQLHRTNEGYAVFLSIANSPNCKRYHSRIDRGG